MLVLLYANALIQYPCYPNVFRNVLVSGMHSLGTLGPNLQRDLAARRWSTALSSVGNSQNSAQSLHSIPADGPPLSKSLHALPKTL